MPSIGPQLPPELLKRKRSENEGDEGDTSDSSTGPVPPPKPEKERSPPSAKRARVIGPAPPPAPLDQRPASSSPRLGSDAESDSDDDGFGPNLPSAVDTAGSSSAQPSIGPQIPAPTASAAPAKRDEWMTTAPTNGDWGSRVD